jgi:hypothetical protein
MDPRLRGHAVRLRDETRGHGSGVGEGPIRHERVTDVVLCNRADRPMIFVPAAAPCAPVQPFASDPHPPPLTAPPRAAVAPRTS